MTISPTLPNMSPDMRSLFLSDNYSALARAASAAENISGSRSNKGVQVKLRPSGVSSDQSRIHEGS